MEEYARRIGYVLWASLPLLVAFQVGLTLGGQA